MPVTVTWAIAPGASDKLAGVSAIDCSVGFGAAAVGDELSPPPHETSVNATHVTEHAMPSFILEYPFTISMLTRRTRWHQRGLLDLKVAYDLTPALHNGFFIEPFTFRSCLERHNRCAGAPLFVARCREM